MRRILVLVLLTALPATAEQLWVRNRPFVGVVTGSGANVMVELPAFVEAFALEIEDQGDLVVVEGFPIPVEARGELRLVPLQDIVDAAGLRLSRHPELGTIDVRQDTAGTGSRGDWEALAPENTGRERYGTDVTKIAGATFSVQVPAHLPVVVEAGYLRSEESSSARAADLNRARGGSDMETVFIASAPGENLSGSLSLFLLDGLSTRLSMEEERELVASVRETAVADGATILGESVSPIAGKRFYKLHFRLPTDGGAVDENELYIHFSPKNRTAFFLFLKAPREHFNRVAPQLRLIVRNLRIE